MQYICQFVLQSCQDDDTEGLGIFLLVLEWKQVSQLSLADDDWYLLIAVIYEGFNILVLAHYLLLLTLLYLYTHGSKNLVQSLYTSSSYRQMRLLYFVFFSWKEMGTVLSIHAQTICIGIFILWIHLTPEVGQSDGNLDWKLGKLVNNTERIVCADRRKKL